ncbi:MAG: selenocysteine-specific translation elongation factor [Spirochaetes bacterium]|nr:selenocysteine-specific translation elongation factor [Spirochaetota bacterium]
MPVIGTAGHVDHGKTLLIRALTGVDTDTLPEEKQRGMTIDLGFAHFLDPNEMPIGVIDVPGHERYIRNMVAGAWGIDCALLVVAVDDGWMPQTETHARVLSVFRIPRIILVLNKVDLVSHERIHRVEQDALSRCRDLFGFTVPVVRVSAKTGEGIGLLKEVIVSELKKHTAIPQCSRLYIDRVFSLKGTGTIVAGSLRKGRIQLKDELLLLPRKEWVRVRRIQTYHRDCDEVIANESTGSVRVALNLSSISAPPKRGDCLLVSFPEFIDKDRRTLEGYAEVHKEFLAVGYLLYPIRAQQEAEVAFGTTHRKVRLYRVWGPTFPTLKEGSLAGITSKEASEPKNWELLRGVLSEPSFLLPSDRFLIVKQGGSDILGWGEVIWIGKTTAKARNRVASLWKEAQRVPEVEEVAGAIQEQQRALQKGTVRDDNSIEKETEKLYLAIQGSGEKPWELVPGRGNRVRLEVDRLCKSGMIIPLDSSLYLEAQAYVSLVRRILKNCSVGSSITIAEVKQKTGLSRKYLLPLLNRMERDGWVKRRGDDRMVLKTLAEG